MSLRLDKVGEEKEASGGNGDEAKRMPRASVRSATAALKTSVEVEVGMET
jgi:hypothetical protein